MTVSPSIPANVEMRRGRFAGIVVLVAAFAAAITWALVAYVVNTGSDSVQASTRTPPSSALALAYANALGTPAEARVVQDELALDYTNALGAPAGARVIPGNSYVDGITSLGRVQQAAAFGGHGAVLDALGLSPRDKKYVQGMTSLTRAEQAAAFGGNR